MFFVGLALVAAVGPGARLAWVPTIFAGSVLFTFGHRSDGGRPQPWALTNVPSLTTLTWFVALAVAAAGLTTYAKYDSRPVKGSDTSAPV